MMRSIGIGSAAGMLIASAAAAEPASPTAASLVVDIDEDGKPDRFDLRFDPRLTLFWVSVTLGNGMEFTPLLGRVDPGRVKLSLTLRAGRGDIRCSEWRPHTSRYELGCGVPVSSHGQPDRLVVVDTGAAKFLLIYGPQPEWGKGRPAANAPVYFQVMPAIEGALQPLP